MTKETHKEIRKLMTEQGLWESAMNLKVYSVDEFISEIGENHFSPKLITLLKTHVKRLQKYLDDRILEPLVKEF